MSILESTFAGAMETAIKTRTSFDAKARESLTRLEGRVIQFNMSGQNFHLTIKDSRAEVRPDSAENPDLELSGSMASISQALMTSNINNISLHGEEALLDELHVIFGPPMDPKEVSEKAKAARDYGIAAAKSAMETISTQFANLSASSEAYTELEARVSRLEAEISELRQALDDINKA